MKSRFVLAGVLLAIAGAATAQQLPRQAEFYFDTDSAQRPVLVLKDRGDAAIARLMRQIERRPDAVLEGAQLAHFAMEAGRHDLGRQLYDRALRGIGINNALWRPVKWNYGWDLYRAGDAEAALVQWSELGSQSLNPGWLPPTLALALWKLDRRAEAVQWYAAAVRTEPRQWSTTDAYAQLLPDWRDDERAVLAEVQAAWAADPPAWP